MNNGAAEAAAELAQMPLRGCSLGGARVLGPVAGLIEALLIKNICTTGQILVLTNLNYTENKHRKSQDNPTYTNLFTLKLGKNNQFQFLISQDKISYH